MYKKSGTCELEESNRPDAYSDVKYRYYVLFLLGLAYAFNFIDRQLISILQESIKLDLGLSDTQLGLLTGLAFAFFYVLAGIPIARWADRSNRRNIISMSVGIWSIMTAFSGAATNYIQLLLARIGVGIGEAGCSPPAHSIISDIFPPDKRSTAIGLYSMGVNIGILFGFFLGGLLNMYLGWRVTFIVVGLPGIALGVLIRLTVKEPARGRSDVKPMSDRIFSVKDVVRHFLSQKAIIHLCAASSLTCVALYGVFSWSASFFIRVHQMQTDEVGIWLALSSGVCGAVGTFLGGFISDKLGRKSRKWYLWQPAITILVCFPSTIFVFSTGNTQAALVMNLLPGLLMSSYIGPAIAMLHSLVEPRMRALASGIFFFVISIVGLGLGPSAIGVLSDTLAQQEGINSLRIALVWVIPTACIWSAAHFYLASRHISRVDVAGVD